MNHKYALLLLLSSLVAMRGGSACAQAYVMEVVQPSISADRSSWLNPPSEGVMAEGLRDRLQLTSTTDPRKTFFSVWRDHSEDAFRVGVPTGWRVSGGVVRASHVDVRPVVRAESPDGIIKVFLDDADLRPLRIPNTRGDFRLDKGNAVGPWGTAELNSRYLTGEQFAAEYVVRKLCPHGNLVQSSPLPGATRQFNARVQPIGALYGIGLQANVGEAYIRCGDQLGYSIASTIWIAPGMRSDSQIWVVSQLGSVIVSDPSRAVFAAYVLHTMLETFAMNPQWETQQARLAEDASGASIKMRRAVAQSIRELAKRRAVAIFMAFPDEHGMPVDACAKWAGEEGMRPFKGESIEAKWMHTPKGENVRVANSTGDWWVDKEGNVVAGMADGQSPAAYSRWLQVGFHE